MLGTGRGCFDVEDGRTKTVSSFPAVIRLLDTGLVRSERLLRSGTAHSIKKRLTIWESSLDPGGLTRFGMAHSIR